MVSENLIAAGLARLQQRAGKPALVCTHLSIEHLASTFNAAHARHASAMRSITKTISTFDDDAAKRIASYRKRPDGSVRSIEERRNFANEVKRDRAAVVRSSFATMANELNESRRDLLQHADSVKRSRSLMTPWAIASAHDLGGERRSRLFAEVSLMQPATLANLARRCEAEQDRELCSVLVGVCDKMAPRDRPFSSQDLAAAVFGERSNVAMQHAAHVVQSADAAIAAERALESGRSDSLAKIEAALNDG